MLWQGGLDVPSIVIHRTWTLTAGDLIVSALDALGLVPSTSLQSAVESNETFSDTQKSSRHQGGVRLHYFGHEEAVPHNRQCRIQTRGSTDLQHRSL